MPPIMKNQLLPGRGLARKSCFTCLQHGNIFSRFSVPVTLSPFPPPLLPTGLPNSSSAIRAVTLACPPGPYAHSHPSAPSALLLFLASPSPISPLHLPTISSCSFPPTSPGLQCIRSSHTNPFLNISFPFMLSPLSHISFTASSPLIVPSSTTIRVGR